MQNIIEKFAPIYHFDSFETHYPLDLNSFIENKLDFNTVNGYVRHIDENTMWIYYICFYLKDGGTKCCLPFNCYCTNVTFSEHEYDYEIVIIEVKNGTVCRACFCPHGLSENYWIDGTDSESGFNELLDKRDSNRIHVYVSRQKHASYPVSGIVWRYFGFANDYNDNRLALMLKPRLLTNAAIDSQLFSAKKKCLSYDYNTVQTITISRAKYHMMFG